MQKIESIKEKPLLSRASWYTVLVFSKHCRYDDIFEGRLLMESGMLFRRDGGWLHFLCTCNGNLPYFVYG